MGSPKVQTAGGGANTGTAQNWNNFLGGELNSGGFNSLMQGLQSGQGYQNYNSFFNNAGGGVAGGMPQIGNPFQTPNYNNQGASANWMPGQNATTNFSNQGLQNSINGVGQNAQANQINFSGLGGLGNMFMGLGGNQSQGLGGWASTGTHAVAQPALYNSSQVGQWVDNKNGTWSAPGFAGSYSNSGGTPTGNPGDFLKQLTQSDLDSYNQANDPITWDQFIGTAARPDRMEEGWSQTGQSQNSMGSGGFGGLPTVAQNTYDPSQLNNYFSQFLSGGANNTGGGFQFQTPQIGQQNLDVNSPYAQAQSALLKQDYADNSLGIMNRLSAGGGGLFGTAQGQLQGLMDRQALPAIGQAVANANLQQGQLNQTGDIANQNAFLTSQNNQANYNLNQNQNNSNILGLMSNNQLGNRGLDVSQRNVDANNLTSNQQAGLNAQIEQQKLALAQQQGLNGLNLGVAQLLNSANDSQNSNYLNAIGQNNQLANNQSNFNLNNAGMQNSWNSNLNSLMFNNANANAGYGQNAQIQNANNMLQNQGQMNNYQNAQGNIGLGLSGLQNSSMNNILSQLFGAYGQSNQIGSPQAQVFQQPSMGSQIFNGIGGLTQLFGSLFGQNGAFPNVLGQNNQTTQPTATGQFGNTWRNPIPTYPTNTFR